MKMMKRQAALALFGFTGVVLATLMDSLSTYMGCGVPGVVEANPFYDDPCRALDWAVFFPITVSLWFIVGGLLLCLLLVKQPLSSREGLRRFSAFLAYHLWERKSTAPALFGVAVLWVAMLGIVSESWGAINNITGFFTGFYPIHASHHVLHDLEHFVGEPWGSVRHGWLKYAFTPLPLAIGLWLTWQLLRLHVHLLSRSQPSRP